MNTPILWAHGRVASVDVESTGLDPTADRIVELAVVVAEQVVIDGAAEVRLLERRSWLINPTIPIPEEATAIHKITNEMVAKAPTFAEVAIEFGSIVSGCAAIAAYSAEFDRGFVLAEWKRAELAPLAILEGGWLDPLVWIRERQRYEKGGKKLVTATARLGITPEGDAHRALADATMAARVLLALRRPSAWAKWQRDNPRQDLRAFFPAELGECLAAQARLRAEQTADFEAWRSRQSPQKAIA